MTNVKELEKFVNEVFDKDLEDVDSGWDYDYIMVSRAYSKATSEQERLEQKALMDRSAAEMIYRYNTLEHNLYTINNVVQELINRIECIKPFDFENFEVVNGHIKEQAP